MNINEIFKHQYQEFHSKIEFFSKYLNQFKEEFQ